VLLITLGFGNGVFGNTDNVLGLDTPSE
jgi:hypothetical protein